MKFIPFKRFVQSRKGGAWGQDAGKDEVDVSCVRVADFEYDKLTSKKILSTIRSIPARQYKNIKLNKGDILIEKSGGGETTLVGRAISFDQEIDTICSNFIERIEIKTNKLEPKFACYILASAYSNKINASCIKQTTGIQNLDVDAYLSSVLVPDIPKEKQRRIVDFLESKIKDISDSIFKKRVCLQKLSEYRQSLITQAVTKGLDPNVEMKDSGVPWVGMIPYHWKCGKIKYFASISAGGTPDRTVKDYWNNGTIPWIKTGELLNDDIVSVEECITPLALRKSAAKLFPEGTVLVAMYGQGKTRGMAGMLTWPATTNQACACICPKNSLLLGKFLLRLMESSYAFNREKAAGTGQPNLNQDIIANLLIPIPPLDEQMKIINHLDVSLKHIQHMKGTIDGAINKLQEYRSSLITAVVTGKIDINEVNR